MKASHILAEVLTAHQRLNHLYGKFIFHVVTTDFALTVEAASETDKRTCVTQTQHLCDALL